MGGGGGVSILNQGGGRGVAPRGTPGGLWGGGGGGVAPRGTPGSCGDGEEDSCYRTSWVGTGTTLAWVSHGGRGLDNHSNGVWC